MVLSKAGFFHKKYLEMYTNQMPPSIRRYVDENRYSPHFTASPVLQNCLRVMLWRCPWIDWHVECTTPWILLFRYGNAWQEL
jgi:hypothetical protein